MKMHSDEHTDDVSQESTGWLDGRTITASEMKFAQILSEAGILSPDKVDRAIAIACETHQAIESVLVMKFGLTDLTIKNTHLAISMIEAALTERHVAVHSLFLAHVSNLKFGEVIIPKSGSLDLEYLLLESGIAAAWQLKEAKRISNERHLRLGVSLLLMKAVPFTHINYALECLQMVKENRLTKEQAVSALSKVKQENSSLQNAIKKGTSEAQSTSSSHIKVGELLLGGRIVNEFDILATIEQAIESRRLIGALLVDSGLVSEQTIKDILLLQSFCVKGVIDKRSAVRLLRKATETNEDLNVTARCLGTFHDDTEFSSIAMETLYKGGFVNDCALLSAQKSYSYLEMGPLRALVATGTICASARIAALECAQLQARNLITQEQAIKVLHHCDRHNTGYEEAFRALDISSVQNRQNSLNHTITTEFRTNRALAPKMHHSIQFCLMMLVASLTLVGTVVLKNMDPCNLQGYAIPFLLLNANLVIFRLGQIWIKIARRRVQELAERQDTALETVSRLKPVRAKVLSGK